MKYFTMNKPYGYDHNLTTYIGFVVGSLIMNTILDP